MKDERACGDYVLGKVTFTYKLSAEEIKRPSSKYDAWRAFMVAHEPDMILAFIVKNFDVFKDVFPCGCVWLDLNNVNVNDIMRKKNRALREEFKAALAKDMKEHDSKGSKNV